MVWCYLHLRIQICIQHGMKWNTFSLKLLQGILNTVNLIFGSTSLGHFFTSVRCFWNHPQASRIDNHSSWQNLWSSTKSVVVLAQTCFFTETVHMFPMGFKSGLWEDHSKTSVPAWFSSLTLMCVLDSCPVGTPAPKTQYSDDNFRASWRIWRWSSSSLFHLLSLEQQIHWQQNSHTVVASFQQIFPTLKWA